jgi:endonuclease/exonuclease/phosphatase family metal-dependent hydrolase
VAGLLTAPSAPIYQEKHFVLLLQEVFKDDAFLRLKAEAKRLGFHFTPSNSQDATENGVVTITNLPILESHFTPFSQDHFAKKGILYTLLDRGRGQKIAVANVHTVFSNTTALNQTHIKQFQEVGAFVAAHRQQYVPFIVGGDFNAGPDMRYAKEFYPMAQTIWFRGLSPFMEAQQLKWVHYEGHTWDNNNPLIANPTLVIQLANYWEQGSFKWELSDSQMDHIFVSQDLEVKSTALVMNTPVELKCPGRMNSDRKSTLSDHYGLMVKIKLND